MAKQSKRRVIGMLVLSAVVVASTVLWSVVSLFDSPTARRASRHSLMRLPVPWELAGAQPAS